MEGSDDVRGMETFYFKVLVGRDPIGPCIFVKAVCKAHIQQSSDTNPKHISNLVSLCLLHLSMP